MSSVRPSLYCGATRLMRHSGNVPPTSSRTMATTRRTRPAALTGRSRMRCMAKVRGLMVVSTQGRRLADRPSRLDGQVALHLLMQRRTEVRAVERVDAGLARGEPDRLRLARIDHHVHVVLDDAQAVNHVGGLFDVGHVDGDLVARLRL